MKKMILFGMLVCLLAGLSLVGPYAWAEQNRQVLLIINQHKSADLEFMLTKEAGVMKENVNPSRF